jgi:hypothetical protein
VARLTTAVAEVGGGFGTMADAAAYADAPLDGAVPGTNAARLAARSQRQARRAFETLVGEHNVYAAGVLDGIAAAAGLAAGDGGAGRRAPSAPDRASPLLVGLPDLVAPVAPRYEPLAASAAAVLGGAAAPAPRARAQAPGPRREPTPTKESPSLTGWAPLESGAGATSEAARALALKSVADLAERRFRAPPRTGATDSSSAEPIVQARLPEKWLEYVRGRQLLHTEVLRAFWAARAAPGGATAARTAELTARVRELAELVERKIEHLQRIVEQRAVQGAADPARLALLRRDCDEIVYHLTLLLRPLHAALGAA